jgi:hypothetical protein
MADRIQSYKVICGGGLNSNENHLDLAENNPGSATRLVNYEVSLFGGYRRLEGFQPFSSTHQEVDPNGAEGAILSLTIFKDDTLNEIVFIASRKVKKFRFTATAGQTDFTGVDDNARTCDIPVENNTHVYINGVRQYLLTDFTVSGSTVTLTTPAAEGDIVEVDPNEYSFYRYEPSGWTKYAIDHSVRRSCLDTFGNQIKKIRDAAFNFGDGNKVVFVDGGNPALVFDGQHWDTLLVSGDGSSDHQGAHSPGGDQCLSAPALVDIFENHLFLGGDVLKEATIAHSAPNNPYDFTAASGAGQVAVGFDVVQFKPFRDNLFVFGSNGIKKVTADVTAGFVIDQVTSNVGCIARDSVLEIGGDLVFLAPDGIRPVAGTSRIGDVELETISKDIQQLLTDLPRDYDLDTLVGVVIRSKSQLRFFIGDGDTGTRDSFGIIGGLRSADQRLGWEFGELIGIRASATASAYVGRQELILHGDYNGKVYQQEIGTQFDGEDILAIYSTPYYDFGDTEVRKTMRKVNTFIRAEGPLTVNMAVNYDWDDPTTARPSSYSQESKGAPVRYKGRNINYGGVNINYGGNEKPIVTTSIQGSGYATQLTYVTLGDFDPYSIQGIVFEFSIAGRR